jgi:hypothetical protein
MVATTFGILIGPAVCSIIDIRNWFIEGIDADAPKFKVMAVTENLDSFEVFLLELAKLVCAIQVTVS